MFLNLEKERERERERDRERERENLGGKEEKKEEEKKKLGLIFHLPEENPSFHLKASFLLASI